MIHTLREKKLMIQTIKNCHHVIFFKLYFADVPLVNSSVVTFGRAGDNLETNPKPLNESKVLKMLYNLNVGMV